ncbi:hypothetical protein E4U19_006066 [Claviceps sp. Clav32 group G5]|nr:hypothetical protein E4U19_006066 [Claviceps sp. Clav32 group G5]KAG6051747.1 hypothetical protein E4U39_007359 [Claviceps sp. Clav50 group G5]
MTAPDPVLGLMTKMANLGGVVVQDQPKLDLDLYLQNYVGRTRFDRLLHIGKTSVYLCVDALRAAVIEAKKGHDVLCYLEALECLKEAAPDVPEAQRDSDWVHKTEAENKAETTRLENELKGYTNNLIKESIRMGNEDLGKHFEDIGKLKEATEAYTRMRHDVSTTKHIRDCGKHLVNVSLHRRDFKSVLSSVSMLASAQASNNEESMKAHTVIGSLLAHLGLGNFEEAIKELLGTNFNEPPTMYNHMASPNDIAIYGGLLALATMDREKLQAHVLEHQTFRIFLEHEPHIRRAIGFFVGARYSSCLSILEASRPDFLLDIHLQKHVPEIFAKIRSKCIVQYFVPFSCVSLETLDAAFASPGTSVVHEVAEKIRDGSLKARIDAKEKLLVAVEPDSRELMQSNALKVARLYEKEAKERLRHMSLAVSGLGVVGVRKAASADPGAPPVDEAWFDEMSDTHMGYASTVVA